MIDEGGYGDEFSERLLGIKGTEITSTNPAPPEDDNYLSTKVKGLGRNKWKEIKLHVGGVVWSKRYGADLIDSDIRLSMDKDIVFTASTQYDNLMDSLKTLLEKSSIMKVIDTASQISTGYQALVNGLANKGMLSSAEAEKLTSIGLLPPGVKMRTSVADLPFWKSTAPVTLGDFSFKFYLGMAGKYDGRTEVYNPALALYYVNQPTKTTEGMLIGPMPMESAYYGQLVATLATQIVSTIGMIRNGEPLPELGSLVSNSLSSTSNSLLSIARSDAAPGRVSLRWGQFSFPEFVVGGTSVTFSRETDTNGFPIYAQVDWRNCRTLETAYQGQIPFKSPEKNNIFY